VLSLVLAERGLLGGKDGGAALLPRPDAFLISAGDPAAEAALPRLVGELRRAGLHVRHPYKATRNVGKLLGEALEEAQPGPIEALKATGAPWPSVLLFGYWPQVKPAFWAIMLLRWDISVRESSVLGLVGAGGIGVVLGAAMNLFQWDRVAVVLIAIFVVVLLAEVLVTWVRGRVL
jgi:hypothetical protein